MSNDRVSGERRASIEPAGVGTYHLLHMLLIDLRLLVQLTVAF
jgi:hypothetical protein